MRVIFYNYFQALLHPIKFHKYLREVRNKVKNQPSYGQKLRIANDGETDPKALGEMFRLSFFESLSISWGFVILQALYSYLGLWVFARNAILGTQTFFCYSPSLISPVFIFSLGAFRGTRF